MSAEAQIKLQIDRLAKGRQASQATWSGDDFWTKVDAAADETYENRIKGSDITAMDTALGAGAVFSAATLAKWFQLHNQYFQVDLGYSAPLLEAYLAAKGWRVPWEFAECYFDALNSRLSSKYVFPKGTRVADEADPSSSGMLSLGALTGTTGASTWAAGTALTRCYGALVAISRDASPGGTPIFTCTLQDATTKDITLTPDATQYGQILLGSQVIGAAGAAAGQKVIPVAATAQFKAAEYVLLVKADFSVQELVLVASLVANTSLTATSNLINSFVENDLVLPLFTDCVWKSGNIANATHIDIYGWPDRIIAL